MSEKNEGGIHGISQAEVNEFLKAPGPIGATTPNTGAFTTVVASTAIADNDSDTQLATTAFAKSQDAVLRRTPPQAVNMTEYSVGASGITVADDGDINFGAGNFTLCWTGSVPNWATTSTLRLFGKYQDTNNRWQIHQISGRLLGYLHVKTATTVTVNTTISHTIVNGTVAALTVVITRETASANGSVSFYINGLLHETIVITAGAPLDISNTGLLYVSSNSVSTPYRLDSTTSFAATFNRALTAAEVLDLYRNGIAFADKWGSQTSIITGNDSTFAGASNWANVDINAYDETTGGVLTITANAAGQYCTLPIANATTVANKKYRLEFDVTTLTATWTIKDFGGTVTIGTISATGAGQKIEFTASTTGGLRLVAVDITSAGVLDNFLLYEIGATFALQPEGIQVDKWKDSSPNANNASYPASGSSFTRPFKTDNAEMLLSTTIVSLAANADTTIYTVPTGKSCILTKAILVAGADAGSTDITIGQNGAETDWIGTTQCDNLDAANDCLILQPVPAATSVKSKVYAAGTVIQINVANQAGGATNTLYLYGFLI